MRAVWRAARAAVRRRRLQTAVIAAMVAVSAALLTLAAGLLAAASAPFDHAFRDANGAHLAVVFDAEVDAAGTARTAGVTETAGPFSTARLGTATIMGELLVVGRTPAATGPDRLTLTDGRWARGPGEIVLSAGRGDRPPPYALATKAGRTVTVVGLARSVTRTADAWTVPESLGSLGPSAGTQMLYRFADASSEAAMAGVTRGLPPNAVRGTDSWLKARAAAVAEPRSVLPFIVLFGALGLVTAILIIANAVSGAVVAGLRHIGVLKALGFTPAQVTGVYVTMVAVPAVVGCLVGVAAGNVLAAALLARVAEGLDLPSVAGVGLALDAAAVAVVLAAVGITALVPAARAGRLPAHRVIAAHAVAPESRSRRAQTWLSGLSLPRPVTLGLALPLARPGRTALTVVAVAFGVMSVTFAYGLHVSVAELRKADSAAQVTVDVAAKTPVPGFRERVEGLIAGLPGSGRFTTGGRAKATVDGLGAAVDVQGWRDPGLVSEALLKGRRPAAPGEVAVSGTFLRTHHRAVGDTLRLRSGGGTATVRIVGAFFAIDPDGVWTHAATLKELDPASRTGTFLLKLAPGTDPGAYAQALPRAMEADPSLSVARYDLVINLQNGGQDATFTVLFATLALLISAACGLGVLNTVVLTTRERGRDLGVLKALGMTPPQVVAMMVVSMTALGLVGGVLGAPAGLGLHRLAMTLTDRSVGTELPAAMYGVPPVAALLALPVAGALIAALGALPGSLRASRLRTAAVLRGE